MAQRQTERTEKEVSKLTSMIIPSSLFPVCHGSDFSSSWSYVDLSFSMGFSMRFSLPTLHLLRIHRRHWATECLWKWLAEGDGTSNPKSWGSLGKCFRRPWYTDIPNKYPGDISCIWGGFLRGPPSQRFSQYFPYDCSVNFVIQKKWPAFFLKWPAMCVSRKLDPSAFQKQNMTFFRQFLLS